MAVFNLEDAIIAVIHGYEQQAAVNPGFQQNIFITVLHPPAGFFRVFQQIAENYTQVGIADMRIDRRDLHVYFHADVIPLSYSGVITDHSVDGAVLTIARGPVYRDRILQGVNVGSGFLCLTRFQELTEKAQVMTQIMTLPADF